MKCPNCGYERQAKDDAFGIIPSSECPKCGAIYEKVKIAEPVPDEREDGTDQFVAAKGKQNDAQKTPQGIRLPHVLALCLVVLVMVATYSLFGKKSGKTGPPAVPFPAPGDSVLHDQGGRSSAPLPVGNGQAVPLSTDQPLYQSVQALVKRVNAAVVLIKTNTGTGSGFFARGGNVITNHHVLRGASSAQVTTIDGNVYAVSKILAEDVEGDLVMFSVDIPVSSVQALPVNASLPEQGENVVVIGNPYGLEHSVSTGVVAAVREDKAGVRWIQLTAPISPGNSGGPVLNMRGEVVGVASSGMVGRGAQNLNFAVSGERVANLNAGSGFPLSQLSARASGGSRGKEVYCYLDAAGGVRFVDWRTEVLLSNPDGSLDRTRYEEWVFEVIGGNPANVNPSREAQSFIDEHRKELYERIFHNIREESLTLAQQQFWHNSLNRAYVDTYNRAAARKNSMISRYVSLMRAFDEFSSERSPRG